MASKTKTVELNYIGAVTPVDVPLAGLANVKRGDTVEVPAEVAGRGPGAMAPVESPDHPIETLNEQAIRRLELVPDHHFLHRQDDDHTSPDRTMITYDNGEPAGNWFSYDPGEGLLAQPDNWELAGKPAASTEQSGE